MKRNPSAAGQTEKFHALPGPVVRRKQPYRDGGVYSDTPIEVAMDDVKRRNSVVFSTRRWQQEDDDSDGKNG